jgi:hypothetical protein
MEWKNISIIVDRDNKNIINILEEKLSYVLSLTSARSKISQILLSRRRRK